MLPRARLLSSATALPPHRVGQEEVRALAAGLFGADPRLAELLPIFDRSGVSERYFAQPIDWYRKPPSFGARNDAFVAGAVALGETCLDRALAQAGRHRHELDHLVFTTTTGVATPSIEARLLHRMGLRSDLQRTPIFGSGCAGGAVALARAAELARARPGALFAVLSVELCSLTFQADDHSPQNLVGTALFGDGAAAVLLSADEGAGARVIADASHSFPASLDIMGWRVDERGLGLVLSKELPELLEEQAAPALEGMLEGLGLESASIEHFAVHPGGPRVVDAMERALALPGGRLDATRRLLRSHGNLSSASVLFLLDELLRGNSARAGERALLLAFGPGFSAELVVLEWS